MSWNFSHRFFVTVVIYVIFRVYVAKKIPLTLLLLLLLSGGGDISESRGNEWKCGVHLHRGKMLVHASCFPNSCHQG